MFRLVMRGRAILRRMDNDRYLEILQNVVEIFLEHFPMARASRSWYQMDGAPSHNTGTLDTKIDTLARSPLEKSMSFL